MPVPTPVESAVASAAAPLEAVVAAAETAVEVAEERAEAAEQVAALVVEAAADKVISDRVTDLEEELEACHGEIQNLENRVTALQSSLTEALTKIPQMVTLEILTAEIAKLTVPSILPQPHHQPNPEAGTASPGEAPEGPEVPEGPKKPKRFHLT